MSDGDAYQDEMGFRRFHDVDDPEFAALIEELRTAYRRAPDPRVESRHIAAILAQSQRSIAEAEIVQPKRRSTTKRPTVLAKLAIATAGLGLLTGGLALAGMNLSPLQRASSDTAGEASAGSQQRPDGENDAPGVGELPEDASDTAERVVSTIEANLILLQRGEISGCEFAGMVSAAARLVDPDSSKCPDEGTMQESPEEKSDTAVRVLAVIETNLPQLKNGEISGCEFGAMVSAAARNVEPDPSRCSRSEEEAAAVDTHASKSNGRHRPAKDKARSDEAKSQGQAQGEEASGGKANAGGNGNGASGSGQATASEAQSQGQAQGEEASGGNANAGGNGNGQAQGEEASGGNANAGGNGNGQAQGEEASDGKANPGGPPKD
jgi:hypothetical protein